MILIAILTACLCACIAWAIWHDSKKLRAEDERLEILCAQQHTQIEESKSEVELLRSRVDEIERCVKAELAMKKLGLTATHPAGQHPMQQFDPQAARRAQEQARRKEKRRK